MTKEGVREMKEEEKLAEVHKVKFLEVYKLTTPGLLTESEIDNYNRGLGIGYEHGFLAGLKAGKDMNVSTEELSDEQQEKAYLDEKELQRKTKMQKGFEN